MKKLLSVIFVLSIFTINNFAQFTSVKDGEWRVPSTWSSDQNATALPDSNSSVIINHILSTMGGDICRNLTINGKVYGGEYLRIYGDLLNKGELRDHPDHGSDYLTVRINGDIINDGIYITGTTNFEGSADHHLRTYNGNTISFGSAFGRNAASTFIIDSVASISGNFLLGGSKIILPGGYVTPDTLILNNGLIDGGVIECNNNVILGKGNSTIGFSGGFNEQQHTFVKDAILEGYLNFNGSSIDSTIGTTTLLGNVVNNGTIINAQENYSKTIFVEGELYNNGIIDKNGWHPDHGLELRIKSGRLINLGIIRNKSILFYNSHEFWADGDSLELSELIGLDTNTIVNVKTVTDVGGLVSSFDAKLNINMNGGKLILPYNGELINFGMDNTVLNANNSVLKNAKGLRTKTSTITNAKIKYIKTNNPTTFIGDIEIIEDGLFEGNATLNCNITNDGNMKVNNLIQGSVVNNGTWNSNNYILGNITNAGKIDNYYFEISGNLTNEGSWKSISQILLNGTEDQFISMPSDSAIISNSIMFDAMIDGTNYQWTKNGNDISGENSNVLTFSNGLQPDNATYQCIVDGNNSRSIIIQSLTDVEEGSEVIPKEYSLSQNYPNPFNPSTVIEFAIPESGNVNLKIFNSIGEEVAKLVNQEMTAGFHSVNFNAINLSSGIYFYRIRVGTSAKGIHSETNSATFTQTNKMLLIK
ncbi:MAG: T9SS type A sorting domain-containing protein [Melioribacteraceae bacterium]|nr:T9SS type A sorting domain-containing protein [Melioribacteraceae bacterium]